MKKIFIIKVGSTFDEIVNEYGDMEDWIVNYIDDLNVNVINIQNKETLPTIEECLGVIITGSHTMVTQEFSWSVSIEKFIRTLFTNNIPLLGICYGHQLIAKSLGGKVDYHEKGMELGCVEIKSNEHAKNDAIFKYIPSSFNAHVIHSQSIIKLPKHAILLASNDFENTHAFKMEPCTWGVQFHPEFNDYIMKSYIYEASKMKNINENDKHRLINNVKNTPAANEIIPLFVKVLRSNI
ncbi:glutamine amidotransferase [Arcobacter sp. HD9-500m-PIT-SAG03]|nr:glutamine amidotransferase [Arcobacter sp. HD9-500m-PIT-SAG03]